VIAGLDTPELVHVAMLRGTIAPISMRMCAHIQGDAAMEAFNRWDELRGDIKLTSDILVDFAGAHVWEQAQNAVEHIAWLKRELQISQYNESAAHAVLEDERKEWMATRSMLRYARAYLADVPNVPKWLMGNSQHGGGHDEQARQTSGLTGTEQKRTEHGASSQVDEGAGRASRTTNRRD
jgi:hypothetical protein